MAFYYLTQTRQNNFCKKGIISVLVLMTLISVGPHGLEGMSYAAEKTRKPLPEKSLNQTSLEETPYKRVLENKWMSTDTHGNFHAERLISRAELASILVDVYDLNKRQTVIKTIPKVTDVPENHWAFSAIQTVLRTGIMAGSADGRFQPNQKLTRAEAFAIIAQADGVYPFDPTYVKSTLSQYTDAKQLPGWTQKAVVTALEEQFVNTSGKQLRPLQPMTRGDVAYALNQFLIRKERLSPQKGL